MKSARNVSERVTIRLPSEKMQVYEEFKRIVIEKQHSDICYVIGELMEVYVNATKQIPDPDKQIVLRFMKQNIQINMGCNFNYNVKKPKRLPHQDLINNLDLEAKVKLSKNLVLPNLIEQWPTLKPHAQLYWRQQLTKAGILPLGSNPSRSDHHTPRSNPDDCTIPPQDCDICHTQLRRLNNFLWRQANGFEWK